MKIITEEKSYAEVMALPRAEHKRPKKPNIFFRSLVRLLGISDLKRVGFTYTKDSRLKTEKGPYLILMNHSCFLDLEMVSALMYPQAYNIVCTSDGFVGKPWLMREIGCIPTQKFVGDITLITDMRYALEHNKTSVLMYPEASYSFDGCATPLPRHLGMLIQKLGVPVIMIKTEGAFLHDPLYNGLRKRDVKVTADMSLLFSQEETRTLSVPEMDERLDNAFTFDGFRSQFDNGISVDAPFRAEGLERILYKCPACNTEGMTEGHGTTLTCRACGKVYTLTEQGRMVSENGETEFSHIPDWYRWEREEVRKALLDGSYLLDTDVEIGMLVDFNAIYKIGKGHLTHNNDGFLLTGGDGALTYRQKPLSSYGLYSDYFWYEIDDMICIGNRDALYYCFPEKKGVVAKTRLAAEELYKIEREKHRT